MSEKKYFIEKCQPYFDSLYRTAFRFTSNIFDAEDLVQDTLMQAYKNFDKFNEGTNLNAWLHKILHNLFINKYIRKSKEDSNISIDDSEEFYLYKQIVKRDLNPEEEFLKKLESQDIDKGINLLNDEFKKIIILKDVERFSYKEIENILNIPQGSVKSRMNRARKILRKNLFNLAKEKGYIK